MASLPCFSNAPNDFHEGSYLSAIDGFKSELQNSVPNSKEHGELLFNIGSSAYELGDFAKAESYFRQAVLVYEKSCGIATIETSIAKEGLVATLLEEGNLLEAKELLQSIYQVRLNLLYDGHPQLVRLHSLSASIAWELGNPKEARDKYIEALAGIRKIYGNIHPQNASTVQCLGNLYLEIENDWIAEIMHRQARLIISSLYNETHPLLLAPNNSIGAIRVSCNQIAGAKQAYNQAHEIIKTCDQSGSISQIEAMRTYSGLGQIELSEGNISESIELLRNAVSCYNLAWLSTGRESVKATFLDPPHTILANALLTDNKPVEAWQTLEHMRGQVLQLHKLESELDSETRLSITTLRKKLLLLENKMSLGDSSGEIFASWTEHNSELTDLLNHTIGKLMLDSSVDIASVQNNLEPGDAVIGWLDAPLIAEKYSRYVYVIKSEGEIQWRQLTDKNNDRKTIEQFIKSTHSPLPFAQTWESNSQNIWANRFAPAEDLLQNVTRLYAVCSNTMAGVPLDAIAISDDQFLVDKMCIITTPSATLIAQGSKENREPLRDGLLIVADPPYNENQEEEFSIASASDIIPVNAIFRSALSGDKNALGQLPRLFNSRTEALQIAKLFENSELMLGRSASEANLATLSDNHSLEKWRVIHLATHALVNNYSPDRSALVLSQLDLPESFSSKQFSCDDGLMSAREIRMGWDIDADLVVLSACETGLGMATQSDGFLGLTNAFLIAGADNLITSLWKVNDKATQQLMVSFYKRMSEANTFAPAECLMLAKQDLRNFRTESGRRPYNSPSIWASFVLVGGAQ
jgi:CHAT domain-containing protein